MHLDYSNDASHSQAHQPVERTISICEFAFAVKETVSHVTFVHVACDRRKVEVARERGREQ